MLDFFQHFSLWRPLSKAPSRLGFLFAGWIFAFVVLVGSDLYLNRVPPLTDVIGYALLSAVLSPLYGVAVALKGGWLQERYGKRLLVALLAIVLAGVIAAAVISAAT